MGRATFCASCVPSHLPLGACNGRFAHVAPFAAAARARLLDGVARLESICKISQPKRAGRLTAGIKNGNHHHNHKTCPSANPLLLWQ